MAIQTGIAVVYGFNGTVTASGIGSFFNESGDVSVDIKIDEIRNETNDLVGLIHSGETYDATLMFTPKGTTLALAKAALAPPAMGSTVALSAFQDSTPNVINGNWAYVGGWKIAFKKDGIATYELKLKRGATGISIHTAIV